MPTADGPAEDDHKEWETAELLAQFDPTIAPRLIATHPAEGWCRSCHVDGPCSMRTLGEAAVRAARRRARARRA